MMNNIFCPGRMAAYLKVLTWLGAMLLFVPAQDAFAACRYDHRGAQQLGFTFGTPIITFPRDAAIGTVIASVPTPTETHAGGILCQSGENTSRLTSPVANVVQNTSSDTSGLNGVYILNNAAGTNSGVGFRLVINRLNRSILSETHVSNYGACTPASWTCHGVFNDLNVRLEIVKTANVVTLTTLDSQPLHQSYKDGANYSNYNLSSSLTFRPQTCSVTQPGAVNLGALPVKTFTGIGSTAPWGNDFTISVNCSGVASKVFMVLTDAQNPANRTSTLPLTSSSTAAGIGIQIWRKGGSAPISFGPDSSFAGTTNQFPVFTSTGSAAPVQLVFSSRYIQTASTVKPGTANGLATFTMSYQ